VHGCGQRQPVRPTTPPLLSFSAHRGLTARARAPLSLKQSALLPLGAAGALGVAYIVVVRLHLDPRAVLTPYFFLLTATAATAAAAPPLRALAARAGLSRGAPWTLPVPEGLVLDAGGASVPSVDVWPSDAAAAGLALALAAADAAAGHQNFTLANAAAVAVAMDLLRLLGLRSFRAAAALLAGLALYDVTAVFATSRVTGGDSIMLAVATSDALAGPTRLLFPRGGGAAVAAPLPTAPPLADPTPSGPVSELKPDYPFSLLGLGDVAVPGLLASLALRYDASRAVDMRTRAAASAAAIDGVMVAGFDAGASDQDIGNAAADAASAAFDGVASVEAAARDAAVGVGEPPAARPAPTAAALASRPYFTAVVVAYAVGLVAAFGANAVTGAGQPALLYLVPATLGAVAALAALRGDVGKLAAFTDAGPSILGGGG